MWVLKQNRKNSKELGTQPKPKKAALETPPHCAPPVCPALGKQFPEFALPILSEISSVCFGLERNVFRAKDTRVLSTTMRKPNPQPPEVPCAISFLDPGFSQHWVMLFHLIQGRFPH